MSVFEIGMLVCFGASWPVSIYKSLRTRQNAGKSLPFLVLILVGYCSGILHKILFQYDIVTFLYLLNALMVTIDILLYLRNARLHARGSLMEAQRTPLVEEGAEESRQPRVLVAYGSRYGFSQRCAKDLANELTAETDLMDVGKRRDLIWGRYSAVLIGGPIYGGKPLRTLTQFCERNREWLLGLPVGVFICCLSQGEHAAELLGSAFPPWLSAHAFSREILGGEFQSQKLTVLDKILIGNLSGLNVALSFVNERAIKGIAAAVDALD